MCTHHRCLHRHCDLPLSASGSPWPVQLWSPHRHCSHLHWGQLQEAAPPGHLILLWNLPSCCWYVGGEAAQSYNTAASQPGCVHCWCAGHQDLSLLQETSYSAPLLPLIYWRGRCTLLTLLLTLVRHNQGVSTAGVQAVRVWACYRKHLILRFCFDISPPAADTLEDKLCSLRTLLRHNLSMYAFGMQAVRITWAKMGWQRVDLTQNMGVILERRISRNSEQTFVYSRLFVLLGRKAPSWPWTSCQHCHMFMNIVLFCCF